MSLFYHELKVFRSFPFTAIMNSMSVTITEQGPGEWDVLWAYIEEGSTWVMWEDISYTDF